MLKGEYGPAIEIAMKAIVKVADALDAEKLVPIAGSHVVNAGLSQRLDAYWGVVRELWKMVEGCKYLLQKIPTLGM